MIIDKYRSLEDLCRVYGLAVVYLFGSKAKEGMEFLKTGQTRVSDPLADLDVGLVTADPLPPADKRSRFYADLYNDFQELFYPFKLDLVLLEENHAVLQYEAVKGYCIYEANGRMRDEYETNILRRAADFGPFLATYLRECLEEL